MEIQNSNSTARRRFPLQVARQLKPLSPFAFHLGEKLLPSDKYAMSEYTLNDYSWQMNLTVKSLEKRDFGEYVCSSVNALGKMDSTVRLQGTRDFNIISSLDFPFFFPTACVPKMK